MRLSRKLDRYRPDRTSQVFPPREARQEDSALAKRRLDRLRRSFARPAVTVALSLVVASAAHAQGTGTMQGFGGYSIGAPATPASSLGGTLTLAVTPNIHVIGEAGRLGNVLPSISSDVFGVPGVKVSAFYGEGGIRALAGGATSPFRPYVEGTFGAARLDISSTRLNGFGNTLLDVGTAFLDRTSPTLGAGAGVLAQAGPIVFDVGYRYKQLLDTGTLGTVLGLGQELRTHEVRAGFGFRF
jgi:opacity protein-like surface antigen